MIVLSEFSKGVIGTWTRWALVAGFEVLLDFLEFMRSHDGVGGRQRRLEGEPCFVEVMVFRRRKDLDLTHPASFSSWDLRSNGHRS